MTDHDHFLADPGWQAATLEMAALGWRVTPQPQPGTLPFGVLAGHAGTRWFLLPLHPRAASRGALALVQPLRRAPRTLRHLSEWALGAGLAPALWRRRVHVAGGADPAGVFGAAAAHCAFLTGTAGPHRKLVVQYMDGDGHALGYAKVSRTPAVQTLLANEAATLAMLHAARLQSARVPRVLQRTLAGGTAILATDTVAGPRGPRPLQLQASHLAFLDELAARTPHTVSGEALLAVWQAQVRGIAHHLSAAWQVRLAHALRNLGAQASRIAPRGLAHGDFTPVNCFPVGGRLFVFDWEYAGDAYPADFDLIRFLDVATHTSPRHPHAWIAVLLHTLARTLERSEAEARARLVAYVCARALRGALRQPPTGGEPLRWAGQDADAALLDALLAPRRDATLELDWHRAAGARHPSGVA